MLTKYRNKAKKEQCTDKETIETQIPQDFRYVVRDFEILTAILPIFIRLWGAFKRANIHKIQISIFLIYFFFFFFFFF